MNVKIGVKLLAGFVPAVMLMTAMALYSVHTGEKSLENSVGKTSIFLAEEMLKTINRDIYLKIEALRVHTSHFLFQKILMESNRQFEGFDNVSEWIDGKEAAWVSAPREAVTPFMKSLIENPLSDSIRKEIAQYYERRYGYPVFGEIFVTNRFGAVIAETNKGSRNYKDTVLGKIVISHQGRVDERCSRFSRSDFSSPQTLIPFAYGASNSLVTARSRFQKKFPARFRTVWTVSNRYPFHDFSNPAQYRSIALYLL